MISFLCGFPRSGSTVLSSILSQNPDIHVTGTSPTIYLLRKIQQEIANNTSFHNNDYTSSKEYFISICNSIFNETYKKYDKPILIDKNRDWMDPDTIKILGEILNGYENVKLICTVRNLADCASSYVRIAKDNDIQLKDFFSSDKGTYLSYTLRVCYNTLLQAFNQFPQCIHIVEYEKILADPVFEMERLHKFLKIPEFKYNFNDIKQIDISQENDKVWEIPNLHKIGSSLKKQHNLTSKEILKEYYDRWVLPEFWKKQDFMQNFISELENLPHTKIVRHLEKNNSEKNSFLLDDSVNLYQDNLGLKFLYGYSLIGKGKLREGIKILNDTRVASIFNKPILSSLQSKLWNGVDTGTLVIYFEGSEGEQLYYARYIPILLKKRMKIVVFCAQSLIPFFKKFKGNLFIFNVINFDSIFFKDNNFIHYDFFITSSFLPTFFKNNAFKLVKPYIKQLNKPKNKIYTIGIILKENFYTKLNNSLYKVLYDVDNLPYLGFDTIGDLSNEIINNIVSEYKITYNNINISDINYVLNEDVIKSVSGCDLIITHSSDVCHFAGSIDKEVWYLSPFFSPYLLQNTSLKQYNRLKIFKQSQPNDWSTVYNELKKELEIKFST